MGSIVNAKLFVNFFLLFILDETMKLSKTMQLYQIIKPWNKTYLH